MTRPASALARVPAAVQPLPRRRGTAAGERAPGTAARRHARSAVNRTLARRATEAPLPHHVAPPARALRALRSVTSGDAVTRRAAPAAGDAASPAIASLRDVRGTPAAQRVGARLRAGAAPVHRPITAARSLLARAADRGAAPGGEPSRAPGAIADPIARGAPAVHDGGAAQRQSDGAARLPVSGLGSAVEAARSTASDIARITATEVARSVAPQQSTSNGTAPGGGFGHAGETNGHSYAHVNGNGAIHQVQRLAAAGESDDRARMEQEEEHESERERWMEFVESDRFQEQVLELLEDRLMDEIDRRGGRYGGRFA